MNIGRLLGTLRISLRSGTSIRLSALILALLTIVVGCGDDDAGSATTDPPASTTSELTTTTQPPGTSTTTAGAEEIFGWLRSFEGRDPATTVLLIDQAEMLTGDEAVAAARGDGVIGADEDLPNDFYIRNPEESTIEFTVAPNVVVTLQACFEGGECVTTERVDLETWSILLGGEEDPGLDWTWYGQGSLPYVFTVASGSIVEIDEVYLP